MAPLAFRYYLSRGCHVDWLESVEPGRQIRRPECYNIVKVGLRDFLPTAEESINLVSGSLKDSPSEVASTRDTIISRAVRYSFMKESAVKPKTLIPIAINFGVEKLYIVTSPADVGAIYKNNTTLSWEAMLDDLLVAFGVDCL